MKNPNAGNPRRLLSPGGDRGSEGTKRERDDEGERSARLHFRQTSPRQDPRINIGPFSRVAKRAVSAAAPGAVGCMPKLGIL